VQNFIATTKNAKKAFYFDVPDEIIIDESNMAVFFCPYCSGRLMRPGLPTNLSKYSIYTDKVPNNDF